MRSVCAEFCSAVQALLGRLPTAGICAALPQCCSDECCIFLFFAAVTTGTVRCNAVYSWRDAEHYTFGANAAFLLLLVHVLPFTMLLGSMLAFLSLHMFGQLLPVTERLLQLAEILCFTAFNSASGDQPV